MTTGDAGKVTGEQRMLIDGKLVEARSGNLFDNLNPATEEVLGQVADAGHEDMDAAIAAARRAFDEATVVDRPRAAQALHPPAAGRAGRGARAAPGRAGGRGRHPGPAHLRPPARRPAVGGVDLARQLHRRVRLGARPARGHRLRDPQPALGGQGGRGRGGGHRAVELPLRGDGQQAGPGPGHRQHRHPEGRPQHAVERHAHRPAGGRAHRLPPRRPPGGHHRRTTPWPRTW